ncbi:MAG: hotdog fold thioesterase, partial [Rubrobacteraceae bacterium]
LNCPPGKAAFGAEISASHVRPKKSGSIRAVGTPVHVGHTSQVWEIRITDEEEKLVCVSRCTVAVVDAE